VVAVLAARPRVGRPAQCRPPTATAANHVATRPRRRRRKIREYPAVSHALAAAVAHSRATRRSCPCSQRKCCTTSTVGRVMTDDESALSNRLVNCGTLWRIRVGNARRLQLREWRRRHGSLRQLDGRRPRFRRGRVAPHANLRNGVEGPVRLVLVGPASVIVETYERRTAQRTLRRIESTRNRFLTPTAPHLGYPHANPCPSTTCGLARAERTLCGWPHRSPST
jgi:hypothetical protein